MKETRFKNTVNKTKDANYRCRKLRLGAGMGRRDGSGKGVRKQVMDVFGTLCDDIMACAYVLYISNEYCM